MISNKCSRDNQAEYPTIQDIWMAKKNISGIVKKTPLIKSNILSEQLDASVCIKLESMHEIGSFKVRGATNKILNLTPEERKRGVITFSTGNHGLAVAHVARKIGVPATVCISGRVPENKVDALKREDASVVIYGDSQDDAEEYCYRLAKEKGLVVIKAFDDPHVVTGQGTIGLELLEDFPEIDTVIVPLSGGGLISGIACAMKSTNPSIRTIGVTMERSAAMYQSLRAGKPVAVKEEDTLADSLLGGIGQNNRYTFNMVKQYVDDTVLVSEEDIAKAMAFLFRYHKLAVEGAAAVGIAFLLKRDINIAKNVAVIISGNNIDASRFIEVTQKYL